MKAHIIKRILKLRDSGLSMNEIQALVGPSKGSVNNIIKLAAKASINGCTVHDLEDEELLNIIYPKGDKAADEEGVDFEALRVELSRPDVNAQLLWEEYQEHFPDGIKRTAFYEHLKQAGPPEINKVSMHQVAKGGERLLIDYSGMKANYYDTSTGKEVLVEVFVANWMASSYLYVEASPTQRQEDWIASHVRALRFFNSAPTYLVPDNLKSGVIKADFYEPKVNQLYSEMAQHYGCAVLPARAYRPQDKASVESNVKFIQVHILGRLRNRKFHSLNELNEAIWELLPQINGRKMQRYHMSRSARFAELDQPYTTELPTADFAVQEIKDSVLVGDDHHVPFHEHYYSVPWRYTGTRVDLWQSGSELLIYADGERITSHPLSNKVGGYTTNEGHRPPNHLFVRQLKPLWVLGRAKEVGPRTHEIIRNMIEADPRHSEVPIRKGLGIIELTREFSSERVESAVGWAIDHAMVKVEDIRRVLTQSLDLNDTDSYPTLDRAPCLHENIRGAQHYEETQLIL